MGVFIIRVEAIGCTEPRMIKGTNVVGNTPKYIGITSRRKTRPKEKPIESTQHLRAFSISSTSEEAKTATKNAARNMIG